MDTEPNQNETMKRSNTLFALGFTFAALLFLVLVGIMTMIVMHGGFEMMHTIHASSLPLFARLRGSRETQDCRVRDVNVDPLTLVAALRDPSRPLNSIHLENGPFCNIIREADELRETLNTNPQACNITLFLFKDESRAFAIVNGFAERY